MVLSAQELYATEKMEAAGMGNKKIATMLGLPQSTTKRRLCRLKTQRKTPQKHHRHRQLLKKCSGPFWLPKIPKKGPGPIFSNVPHMVENTMRKWGRPGAHSEFRSGLKGPLQATHRVLWGEHAQRFRVIFLCLALGHWVVQMQNKKTFKWLQEYVHWSIMLNNWINWVVLTHLMLIPGSRLIWSNKQSRSTRWVRETCVMVGLQPCMIMLITASLSSVLSVIFFSAICCAWDCSQLKVLTHRLPCPTNWAQECLGAAMAFRHECVAFQIAQHAPWGWFGIRQVTCEVGALWCSVSNVTVLSETNHEMNVRNQFCLAFITSFASKGFCISAHQMFHKFLQPFGQVLPSISRCLPCIPITRCHLFNVFNEITCWTRDVSLTWWTKDNDKHGVVAPSLHSDEYPFFAEFSQI